MLKQILDFIYPSHCCLCGNDSSHHGLCKACSHDLPTNHHACTICALPMPAENTGQICGDCLKKPPAFNKIWSPFIYAQPMEWMIQQLKFNHQLYFAELLARQMWRYKPDHISADCIMPMPLHQQRLKQRGFNQSLLLARELSRLSQIPVDNKACQRLINTLPQTGKNARLRRRNIKGAFSYNAAINYQHVIVMDDVITTGSTATELSNLLKRQGVKRVDVWSVARAERR